MRGRKGHHHGAPPSSFTVKGKDNGEYTSGAPADHDTITSRGGCRRGDEIRGGGFVPVNEGKGGAVF